MNAVFFLQRGHVMSGTQMPPYDRLGRQEPQRPKRLYIRFAGPLLCASLLAGRPWITIFNSGATCQSPSKRESKTTGGDDDDDNENDLFAGERLP